MRLVPCFHSLDKSNLSFIAFLAVAVLANGIAQAQSPPTPQTKPTQPTQPIQSATGFEFELLGTAWLAADNSDFSGLTGTTGGIPHDRLGSFGSAIDHLGGNHYIAAADRGPNDGMSEWRCRLQEIEITLSPLTVKLSRTTLLSDEQGRPLVGARVEIDEKDPAGSRRYDPEGIRYSDRGTVFVSDEYGPAIDEFAIRGPNAGKRIRRLAIPAKFTIAHPDSDPDREREKNRGRGRAPNRGFEGLALSPSGRRLIAFPQSPLLQDGAAEVLAIDQQRWIVLERDGEAGTLAEFRRLYLVDSSEASDMSAIEPFATRGVPPRKRALSKRLLIDFMDPKWKLAGAEMPEKLEGLCWGPRTADGRRILIVATDNDLKSMNPNWIWVFAVRFAEASIDVLRGP
jgi:hypothetical protein